ncbi:Zinc knuckle CX2CX4HX4C [Corchorus olitorius]|uniref:Zinc knuckle CX2CX4HX4C n=1 Tax=Corchorus olitorius TaxID=93759 RepID=A0A1R3H1U1_9ROSI|nr:Zinc knuckle CX2CX4HX4C [Corchorus olitorius]
MASSLSNLCSQLSLQEGEQPRVIIADDLLEEDKIGAAVGGVIGPALEFDHQWGGFIRIRVLVDVTKPLVDGSVVSSRYGDMEVEFRYEDMPDICLVCGQFDHLSENDCPIAIEMRLNHGVVIKRYSIRSKAESPRFKAKRFEGNDGSFRLGGSGSRRQPPLSARSGPSRQSMGGEHAVSCEVISRIPGRVVEQNPLVEKSTGAIEKIVEAATNFAKEVDELYGDLGLPASQGVMGDVVVGENQAEGNVIRKNRADPVEPDYSGCTGSWAT